MASTCHSRFGQGHKPALLETLTNHDGKQKMQHDIRLFKPSVGDEELAAVRCL